MPDLSVARSGMIGDINALNLNGTQYPYALNAAVETNSQDGNFVSIQNEGSNVLSTNFPDGFAVIGRLPIHEQNRTLFFLVNSAGDSQIGEILNCLYNDDSSDIPSFSACADCLYPEEKERTPLEQTTQVPYCDYHLLAEGDCFNFNIDFPVNARYRITDCGLNIYFTDGRNQRRYLYFNYTNGTDSALVVDDRFKVITGYTSGDCPVPIYSNQIDCNKINYHPLYAIPTIELVDVTTGGSLKAGSYQFFIAHSDSDGNPLNNYTPATHPIPVFTKHITFETNYGTDKAISLKIRDLDVFGAYSYYNLVVAETVDNFTSFKLVGTFPVSQSSVTYTGNEENAAKLVPDDLFFRRAFYATAGNITSANNFLFYTDIKEFPKPNLQRVANNIKLYWKTVAIPEAAYRDPKNTYRFKGYQRDEVYPFGIMFVTENGEELGPYHIPGPSKARFLSNYSLNVDAIVANNDVLTDTTCNNLTRNKYWQVYNTGQVIQSPNQFSQNCDENTTWQWGEFAYWESTELYPNDPQMWGELCGKPIRYHKFPDSLVTHIHNGLNASDTFLYQNIIYPIGLRVDHASVIAAINDAQVAGIITAEQKNAIKSYRIIRGNRVGNKSIVAKGLLYDMWSYSKFGNTYYYPNYPYNSLLPDKFIAPTASTYQGSNTSSPTPSSFNPTGRYTFHSPDIHFVNPTIGTELKLETLEYGQSEGFFNYAEEQVEYRFLSTAAMTLAFAAGVAAAFSATAEKECVTYTVKANYITNQQNSTTDGSGNYNYQGVYGNVTGSSPGATFTTPATMPLTGSGSFNSTTHHGQSTETHNNTTAPNYDPTTGLNIPVVSDSYTKTTCKGTTYQLLSPISGSPVGLFLQQAVYRSILGLKEMQIMVDLLKALLPKKNFGIQYNSIGRYYNYRNILNAGNKIRGIERGAYLEPIVQLIDEAVSFPATQYTNIYVNNWNRERSVYLRTDRSKALFPAPAVVDNSRVTMDDIGFDREDLNRRFLRTISSYYGSLKNFVPDQYGKITDVEYIETQGETLRLDRTYDSSHDGLYGGDTFISRFGLKIKHPFFLQTRFRSLDESDVKYSELGNAGFPNYYFNTEEPLLERLGSGTFGGNIIAVAADIMGVANSRLDARETKFFYQSGFIHLYNYGIPFFLAESDVNVDYRHGENNLEKDFYPHQQDLAFWLQEKNVPITEDNYYFYNKSYSKQNKETVIGRQSLDLAKNCKVVHPSTIIYSEKQYDERGLDNWLIFKANNQYSAPASYGRIMGVDGIENSKILIRYENTFQIFGAYQTLQTDSGIIKVDNGSLFASPQEFASVPLGYAGSQHRDMIQTEFGHVWVDAKRGQVFALGTDAKGLDEISKNGWKSWFKENLPFQLLRDFPSLDSRDLDNNYKGIGLTISFDKRFGRLFITKLDYKRLNPAVTYDAAAKVFKLNGTIVSLKDKRYFCDRSWTISYNFYTKTWISFHSFAPNFYVDQVDYTQSGINHNKTGGIDSSLWSHNVTNKSYQVYYGTLYPFIIETLSNPTADNAVLNSVEYEADAIRYHNEYDYFYPNNVTFNKAIVYNDRESSGVLELVQRNENDMFNSIQYPNIQGDKIQILVTNRENKWRFNQFFDTAVSQRSNVPLFLNACNNAGKEVNLKALNYYKPDTFKQAIRGRQTRIRLINDNKSNYKILFHFLDHQNSRSDA